MIAVGFQVAQRELAIPAVRAARWPRAPSHETARPREAPPRGSRPEPVRGRPPRRSRIAPRPRSLASRAAGACGPARATSRCVRTATGGPRLAPGAAAAARAADPRSSRRRTPRCRGPCPAATLAGQPARGPRRGRWPGVPASCRAAACGRARGCATPARGSSEPASSAGPRDPDPRPRGIRRGLLAAGLRPAARRAWSARCADWPGRTKAVPRAAVGLSRAS